MARSRVARLERTKAQRKRTRTIAIVAAALVVTVSAGIGITIAVRAAGSASSAASAQDASASSASVHEDLLTSISPDPTMTVNAAGAPIEVPDVVGTVIEQAETLLALAGFSVMRVPTPPGEAAEGTVLSQAPVAGTKLPPGSEVQLVYADSAATSDSLAQNIPGRARHVVCIDPGHQARANMTVEPIGPGSKETKPKVTGGASGAVTEQPEHELALAVSLKLKEKLEAEGIEVVMTRTAAGVDISNRQRAEVANNADADLFVRVHADGSTNGDVRGISALYPSGNEWVRPIEARSLRAARIIHGSLINSTGATDRGITPRADIAGFNWSRVPVVLVECGFLSNPVEDKLLATDEYRDELAEAIARGIMEYLGT